MCLLPNCVSAGVGNVGDIDAASNMFLLEQKIKINENNFDKLVEQAKQEYRDFDWGAFDKLDYETKRDVLENYLARVVFDEIVANYIDDIYRRAKDEVLIEQDVGGQIYYNKSYDKYKSLYGIGQMIKNNAKERHIWHSTCDDCEWGYVKQKDVKILDEIVEKLVANVPSDTHCEKYCAFLDQDNEDRRWSFKPYTKVCEKVMVICYNVEIIPQNYEKFELRIMDFPEDGVVMVHYDYDDISNNTNTSATAQRYCNCDFEKEQDINRVETYVYCRCSIGFFEKITDFVENRNWQNQRRIDIKNGLEQDESFDHDVWPSLTHPVAEFGSRRMSFTLDFSKEETK